jgi:hypothetical protein
LGGLTFKHSPAADGDRHPRSHSIILKGPDNNLVLLWLRLDFNLRMRSIRFDLRSIEFSVVQDF